MANHETERLPGAAQDSPERDAWLKRAEEVIRDACEQHAEVTTHLVWPVLDFPPNGDGRLLGKPLRKALARGWMEKDKDTFGVWRAYDHLDLEPLYSADGVLIRQKALVPVYRSLLACGQRSGDR